MKEYIEKAIFATNNCYAPYSNFYVGTCLICDDDTIYTGCNIENIAFGPSICAERVAFNKAISDGKKDFKAIVIVGGSNRDFTDYCTPCGVCRQVMKEFCNKDFKIILGNKNLEYIEYTLDELLPHSF